MIGELLERAGVLSLLWWVSFVVLIGAMGLLVLLFLVRWGEDFDRGRR